MFTFLMFWSQITLPIRHLLFSLFFNLHLGIQLDDFGNTIKNMFVCFFK